MAPSLKEITLQRMNELGISPKRSLGQNFLINEAVIDKIIAQLSHDQQQTFEIGPGLGALTDKLAGFKNLELIELDRELCNYWRSKNLKVIEGDALKLNWADLVQQKTAQIVSNLPYQISASLVIEFSISPEALNRMVFMFQKEVAERIQAKEDSEAYGMLTVMAQTFWTISHVTDAGTNDFYPRPNVVSRVLKFIRKPKDMHGLLNEEDRKKYLKFIKQAFSQRRKFLLKNISNYLNQDSKKQEVVDLLINWGFDEKVRAERLSPQHFLQLFKILGHR